MLLGGERHAEIDRQPAALVLGAEPVDRQVHADLADAAERREHQVLLRFTLRHDQAPPRPKTSPAGTGGTPPGPRTSRRPASSSPSKRPANSRSGSRTRIVSPRPGARLRPSGRTPAKPSP